VYSYRYACRLNEAGLCGTAAAALGGVPSGRPVSAPARPTVFAGVSSSSSDGGGSSSSSSGSSSSSNSGSSV